MNRAHTWKSSLLLLSVACLLPGVTACTKQDNSKIAGKLDAMNGKLADMGDRLGKLEERLDRMEAERLAAKGTMLTLKDRLADIEKELAVTPAASKAEEWLDEGPGATSQPKGAELAAGSEDLIEDIKKAVKAELKKEEEVKKIEQRKKQGEQTRKWINDEYEGKMKKFPAFAEKIGLTASQEADIRQISEEAFEKVIKILTEAFETPEDEVNWGEVKKKIAEIEKEAEAQIEPYVTEEQGEQLRKFFDIGK